MATNPMQDNTGDTPDPAAAPTDPASDPSQGYTICINVSADGSISVETEPMEAEEPGEDTGAAPKSVSSIREAMQVAMDIYKNNGEAPGGQDDADFAAGFGKPTPPVVQKQRSIEDMA